jgi:putative nucleotidyltransferase with HDIG domain
VTNIILATALVHRYNMQTATFDAHLLWGHTLGVATCASVLAEQSGHDAESAFTGGLLHDIGQLLMFSVAPAAYASALHLHQSEDLSILESEIAVFGYDHAAAGGRLAAALKLPHDFSQAILAHHNPDPYSSDLADIIHVSEVLSHALDLGEQPNNRVPELSELACASLDISWPDFAAHFGEIEARYEGMRIALGI